MWLGPLVPKCVRREVCLLGGRLVVEELDDSRAVVLGDDINHLGRQVIAPANRNTCLDMFQDDLGTEFRRDVLVDVRQFSSILTEKLWMQEFADVMVVSPNASHQPVRADTLSCACRKIGNVEAVMVGSWRAFEQLRQQLASRVQKLSQSYDRSDVEQPLENQSKSQGKHSCNDPPCDHIPGVGSDHR